MRRSCREARGLLLGGQVGIAGLVVLENIGVANSIAGLLEKLGQSLRNGASPLSADEQIADTGVDQASSVVAALRVLGAHHADLDMSAVGEEDDGVAYM